MQEKKNLDTDFTSYAKLHWKGIRDLNGKCKSIKLLQDNIREHLDELEHGDRFLEIIP